MNTGQTSRRRITCWAFVAGLAGTLLFWPLPPVWGQDPPSGGQSLKPFYSITGRVSLSVDAGGSNYGTHALRVEKPNAAAKVNRAFLVAAAIPGGGVIPDGGVRLNGSWVAWDDMVIGAFNNNFVGDVTGIVKPVVDAAGPGLVSFLASEPYDTSKVDGEVLAVVFDDPAFADPRTVALMFGSQALTGDTFAITLREPIDPNEPGAAADMGLAISWSTGGTQHSIVDVQGMRMSSSAGGYDDGYFANGAFITGGGVGDSLANPPDPYEQGNSTYDDELYSLMPYIDATTTEITVYTLNPSYDDNIFFAHFYFSTAAIVSQAIMLTPLTAEADFGSDHTVEAMVQDFFGNPIVDTPVTFEVIAGPNVGETGTGNTDGSGEVSWSYTGDGGEGTDQIRASFIDAVDEQIFSNIVTVNWNMVPQPPVAVAGGPYDGWVNVPIALDGSASWDPDDDIVAHEWDCDNDGFFDDAFGETASCTFAAPGSYTVGLRVRDSGGLEDTDEATVNVDNHAPVSDPGGPYQGPPNGSVTLDGTGSYDVDVGDSITYAWDLDNDGQYDDSSDPQPQFQIGDVPPGTVYTVCLEVTDSFGEPDSACTTLTVANQPPVCDAGGPYAAECAGATTPIQLDGSGSYDADPGDTLIYAWTSDCPGAAFDDPNSIDPILTVDSDCDVSCSVSLTVTDENRISTDCPAAVTVADTMPPTIDTPASDGTAECDGAGNAAELNAWLNNHGAAVASDTCGDVTWSNDFAGLSDGCGATGSATVTFTATDDCGHTAPTTATFTIADTMAPTFTQTPGDVEFECDGQGNLADIQPWLDGAAATDVCGGVTITHDFAGLSDGCGATGTASVIWTATDDCGRQATHVATVGVVDTTPPELECPPDALFEYDTPYSEILAWLNSAVATDACDSAPVIEHDAPPGGFPAGTTTRVTWTATDACGNDTQCSSFIEVSATGVVSTAEKGSVLVFPKVELRWNAEGNLVQDTFISMSNDYWDDVQVLVFFVGETCTKVSYDIELTHNEPTYWSAATGQPKGLPSFTILGDPYPDPEGSGDLVLRGCIVAWAINPDYEQIRWNHLSGAATILDHAQGVAWEYSPYAFQALRGQTGQPVGTPGVIKLDGNEYDHAFDQLLFEFFVPGSVALSGAGHVVTHETDLTLLIVDMDLRQDTQGPYTTKVDVQIWNQQEVSFVQHYCITKWNESLLRDLGGYFLVENLQTDNGRAKLDGLASVECPGSTNRALVGVVAKFLSFDGGAGVSVTGRNLNGAGTEATDILYDVQRAGGGRKAAAR